MTTPEIDRIVGNIESLLNKTKYIKNKKAADEMRQELNEIMEDVLSLKEHQSEIDNYDNYIEELQRNIQRTAPWIFNQYIDPEDLLDFPDDDE